MADLQITGLPALAEAGIQATDVAAVADISATETKKVTIKDLIAAGVALIDDADIPAAKVGTLGTNQVATAAIQANAVTAAKIASGTITATEIADATITGAKLVNDTVTATQIAANAITASELADNAVDSAAIAANAVTTAKITDANVTYAKLSLSDGDIPGAKIATGGITATQLAANSVAASELADDAVDTAAIVDGAVTAVKIATNTITANQIAANAIGASELADNAVDTAAIADGAVTAAKLSGTLAATSIADDAVTTAKILDDAVTSAKLAANAVDAAALADNAVDSGAIASNAVIEAKIASSAVTNAKIADGTITPAKLNTSNLDRSLNVASGNLGINNTITAATRSGITYNAQGLITGTVALAAADLPVATTSAVGGVSVGTGLTVSGAGALSLTNSVTGATVSGITFNNQGMITAATALVAGDLPVSTTSAKGAVQITSGGGLTVDGSGNLSTSTSGISAGTYQSITVNNKGVATAGAALTAGLIPDLAASKITSGSFDAARIANDSIDGSKLSNASTAVFQSIAQSGYPTAQFNGQILFDTVSEDAFIWDGNAWQAITTLTKGSLVFGGTYNASTSKMVSTTTSGIAAGLVVGSNLPSPSSTTDGVYVVVDSAGTPSAPAPVVSLSPPDYILGVTNSAGSSWNEIDLSQTVAGQVASNITFTPYGQLSSTNVQDAIQELETEKLALAGGTITGQVLIGNTGSLVFEGSTVDAYETTITVADPTTSDKTITFPDITGTVITSGDTGTVTSTMLANGTIVNADINASAAIALTKLENVTSAQIIVGNGSNVPTAVAVTGDIGINNAGLTSITAGAIVNADINASAAIAGSKITTGTTSAVGVLQLTNASDSTSTTTAATPAAVKEAKDAADAAATTANAALPKAGGVLTGHLTLDDEKELRFREEDAGGDHYIALKAAAALAADVTLTLPAVAPTAGQVLKANASTPTTLEWGTDSATDSTKMPLAGGTFTGDVTFTGDSSNGLWDKSASAFVANLTGNVTGNVSGSAATVTGAAQSAITSLGTLTGLTVDGDVTLTGAANNVVWDKSDNALEFADSAKAIFGTGGDLEISHTGVFSLISNTGDLVIRSTNDTYLQSDNNVLIGDVGNNEVFIKCIDDGAVELYHNNVKTLATHANGITVLGPEGGSAQINLYSDEGDDNADLWRIDNKNNGTIAIENYSGGSWAAGLSLDSSNNATFAGSVTSTALTVANAASSTSANNGGVIPLIKNTDNTNGNQCGLGFVDSSGAASAAIIAYHNNHASTTGVLTFGTRDAGTYGERMRIDEVGRLLLGTTTEGQGSADDLTIAGSADVGITIRSGTSNNGNIFFSDGTSGADEYRGYVQYEHNNNQLELGSNATTALTLDSSQNATFAGDIDVSGDVNIGATSASNLVGVQYSDLLIDVGNNANYVHIRKNLGQNEPMLNITHNQDYMAALRYGNSGNAWACGLRTDGAYFISSEMGANGGGGTDRFVLTTTSATFAGTVSDSKGNLRSIPHSSQTSNYTLVAADAGKVVSTNTTGWVIPASTFSGGDAVTLMNRSSGDLTIDASALTTLYNSADGANVKASTLTLATRTMATIWFEASSSAYIQASALTVS